METNANPNPAPAAEQTASAFVQTELTAARKSARRTRIGSLIAMGFVTCYMTFLVVTLHFRLLTPEPAAQIISAYAINTVDANLDSFENYVRTEVPHTMRSAPDIIIGRLPVIRSTIEDQLAGALQEYSADLSKQLGDHLDSFVKENQDTLHEFFAQAHDPAFVIKFGDGLEEQLRAVLKHEFEDGKTVSDNLQEGLSAMQQLESRLNRLAYAKDLNPHEQRLKQVIAATMRLSERTL